jgi:fatty-acyl-CoA synthase
MSLQHWTNIGPIRDLRDIERLERIPLAERFDTFDINEWVRRGCDVDPARIAVTFFANGDPRQNPVELSYRDLRARINETANLLDDLGIRENDVVLIMLPNIPEAHIVLLAALARGIACPVNWMLKPEAVQDLIENSHAKVVIALGPTPGFDIWERISSLRDGMKADIRIFSVPGPGGTRLPETDLALAAAAFPSDRLTFDMPRGRNDVVAYVHSGGTTGTPKLVQLTNGGMVHKCWAVTVTMAHETSDVIFADMPLFHIAGFLSCVVLPAVLGSQVVIPTPLGARDKTFLKNYWKFVGAGNALADRAKSA